MLSALAQPAQPGLCDLTLHAPPTIGCARGGCGRYVPVIRADLGLEETYSSSSGAAAFPIVAMAGTKPGRDQEKSMVASDSAALWGQATSAPFKPVSVDTDWYVLQEEAGVRAVLDEVAHFFKSLVVDVS